MRTFSVCADSEVASIVRRMIRPKRMLLRYKDVKQDTS
jgi:hypothetical protein